MDVLLCFSLLCAAVINEERIKSVKSGGSVTLKTGVTEIQTDDVIQWRFGDEETPIAEMTVGAKPSYDSTDERFTDRLKMNPWTGDLTITHITAELSGVYRAKISSSRGTEYRRYRVVISDGRPPNQIKKNSDTGDGTELNKRRSGTKGKASTTVVVPLLNEAEDRCLIS
ncbi:uncharacterized protein LOC130550534 isoform X3 [Triplophysa rosa]|uniref:uncharacterized protein LOC130550534 isoform X3 n=1 Tax=Triplophysa rosa TaxID=992332 RepID=UPI0025461943|nr:uncharacterized protein LOC130550534 isoform X3 [Triplophysa rosa]